MGNPTSILIVEDERIVAEDIETSLTEMNYSVCGIASTGKEALSVLEKQNPDVVLMDIVINGDMDGIAVSEEIRRRFGIPVIFLTAYADESTLAKAKITEPFGYVVKPFSERDLQSAIEIALYRYHMYRKLQERELWFSTTLRSLGDGVIATDQEGSVIFMNLAAEKMTGIRQEESEKQPLADVFTVISAEAGIEQLIPLSNVLKKGEIISRHKEVILRSRDNYHFAIKYSLAPIGDAQTGIMGAVLVFSDISRQKKIMEDLQRERDFTDTLLQISPALFIAVDKTGRIIMANDALYHLLGYQREEANGADFLKTFIPEENREELSLQIQQMISENKMFSREIWLRTKSDREILVDIYGKPVYDSEGKLAFYFIMGLDITSRRKAEEALRLSEERYRGLFETMAQGVVYFDADGRIINCNPAAEKILGRSLTAIKGRHVLDPGWNIIREDGKPFPKEDHPVTRTLRTGTSTSEVLVGLRDAEQGRRWLLMGATPVPGQTQKRPSTVFATFTDITWRRRVEIELESRNRQLNAVNMIASSVSGTLDLKSIMEVALHEISRLVGIKRGVICIFDDDDKSCQDNVFLDVPQKLIDLLHRMKDDQASPLSVSLRENKVRIWDLSELCGEAVSKQEAGSFPESMLLIPIKEGRTIIGAVALFGDRKDFPPHGELDFFTHIGSHVGLAVKNGRLYQEANETLKKLQAAQKKLMESEKLAVLGALANNVVHEIGNPLAAISNSVQVLQRRVHLEGNMRELMDIIGLETERLDRSVRELREFSKPKKYNFMKCDLKEIVVKAITLLSQDRELSFGKRIVKKLSEKLPLIEVDPDAMQRIVINILKNALQSTEENGEVTVILREGRRSGRKMAMIEVTDNGCGIPEENLLTIFEPYFSTKARGMGLGMHIVKNNVEGHNGEINVKSELRVGTTVTVALPLRREDNGETTGS